MPPRLMSDEGVHEIQLNGKQLVFMFMAVTVVAVVIFLCGVMVGRGVRAPRATELADAAIEAPIDPTASVQTSAPPSTNGAEPSAQDAAQNPSYTYSGRLTGTPPPETLKEPVPQVQEVKAPAPAKTPAADPRPPGPPGRTPPLPKPPSPAAVSNPAGAAVVFEWAAP